MQPAPVCQDMQTDCPSHCTRSSALWLAIHSGWYDFEQRFRDAELVKKITKPEIIEFFETYFFDSPQRPLRRLSIHLDAQRLSPERCASLGPVLAQLELPVDPAQLGEFAASGPTVDQAQEFAEQFLRGHGKSDADIEMVKAEVEKLRNPPAPEGYQVIEDRAAWKKQLEKAPPAHPIAEVNSVFTLIILVLLRVADPGLSQYSDLFPAKL